MSAAERSGGAPEPASGPLSEPAPPAEEDTARDSIAGGGASPPARRAAARPHPASGDAPPAPDPPVLRQYAAVKARHRDALLLFRMGDFYELFYQDAELAARALNITLTARGRGTAHEAPMCGVPHHALDAYVARLVQLGHKVAICDQVEPPGRGRKLLRREVTRVITPGTLADPQQLEARAPHHLAALCVAGEAAGVACVDLSTGHFQVAQISSGVREVWDLLGRLSARELIHPAGAPPPPPPAGAALPPLSPVPDWAFGMETAAQSLTEHLGTRTLAGFGLETAPQGVRAAGALLHYLRDTQKSALRHIDRLALLDVSAHVGVDESTRRNLEIVEPLREGRREETLLGVMDETVTAPGGRLLREWLLHPLRDPGTINGRLEAVAEMVEDAPRRQRLRQSLRGVHDLERLLGRAALGTAQARDLLALRDSLGRLPEVRSRLEGCGAPLLSRAGQEIDPLEDLRSRLAAALADDPPAGLREGGLLRSGYDAEVDELRTLRHDARSTLAALEARERQRTGIASLKVRYNRIFGYFIEVSRSNLERVPPDYERRQTLTGAERFVTPELKQYEEKILSAEERLQELEYQRFVELRDLVASQAGRLRATANAVARVDVLSALGELAARRGYCRPQVDDSGRVEIREGRHPVVEALRPAEPFVPNDTRLDRDGEQILILTGPNMGGKSTYLRQVALITLMAQCGSFVPAAAARVGVVDRVFCRVGASDSLAQGQSTFLVEMQETANILHNATPASLVLLDEVGRGTSTFDGLSLAWAVVEYLHERPAMRAKTLFATHYHELTDLARMYPRVRNYRLAVREWKEQVVFLRRVEEGASDRSYGIQVARLAGVPREVIERAREILRNLESEEYSADGMPRVGRSARRRAAQPALPLFPAGHETAAAPEHDPVLRRLRDLDADRLTPLEALAILADLAAQVRARGPE
jgi:DNA mismatch repair protein MutS